MHPMHPEIKKFWAEAGYVIENENQITSGVITAYKRINSILPISIIETIGFGSQHRINGNWYSEQEMLKIIRLKAFL